MRGKKGLRNSVHIGKVFIFEGFAVLCFPPISVLENCYKDKKKLSYSLIYFELSFKEKILSFFFVFNKNLNVSIS